jgi:hypothetical protein
MRPQPTASDSTQTRQSIADTACAGSGRFNGNPLVMAAAEVTLTRVLDDARRPPALRAEAGIA